MRVDLLVMRQRAGSRFLLGTRALLNLPARVSRLGFAFAVPILVVAWSASDGPRNATTLLEVVNLSAPGLAWAALPLTLGLLTAVILRASHDRAIDHLDMAVVRLCRWFDMQYQPVTSEELLARLLTAVERRFPIEVPLEPIADDEIGSEEGP